MRRIRPTETLTAATTPGGNSVKVLATSWRFSDVDPISAFALVTGAIQGVKTLCATVREAQAAGKEVANLAGEVTGFISQVLEGTDKLQKAEQEIRANPPKNKSLQVLAFEEEMRKLELKQHYEDLRNMIIYELGLPEIGRAHV